MKEIAIRIEQLGKKYRVGARAQHNTLRDVLAHAGTSLFRGLRSRSRGEGLTEFWALADVSLTVERGEVLGIIGPNGAGKSTLLKILSRITEPTTGSVEIRGRVGSLLEVGTGFHSELTGRENAYLSGAILGMQRREIDRKFDEIVEFAEIQQFIDTPVKHYSSGMYLRLAFAVAAHLEPEILIIDEVLAVGDASFQRKCLGKMDSVARTGRTVLFVSHNLDAIQRLSTTCVHLERGTIVASGETRSVVTGYLSRSSKQARANVWFSVLDAPRHGNGAASFVGVRYSSGSAETGFMPCSSGPVEVDVLIRSDQPRTVESIAVYITTPDGLKLVNADSMSLGQPVSLEEGTNLMRLSIAALHLTPGTYLAGLWLADAVGTVYDHVDAVFELKVIAPADRQLGATPAHNGLVPCTFQVTQPATCDADTIEAMRDIDVLAAQ
jgi:lipopolysaccharide transport system ATP-binding protein